MGMTSPTLFSTQTEKAGYWSLVSDALWVRAPHRSLERTCVCTPAHAVWGTGVWYWRHWETLVWVPTVLTELPPKRQWMHGQHPTGHTVSWDRLAHINIAHGCLCSMLPLWGGLRRVHLKDLVLFPSQPPWPLGGWPAVSISLLPITSLCPVLPPPPPPVHHHFLLHLAPHRQRAWQTQGPGCSAIHGTLTHSRALVFFPPSFPIQISHINDFVHSEKLKVAPLPSAKSELVLLRCVVMICHQRDRSEQKEQ